MWLQLTLPRSINIDKIDDKDNLDKLQKLAMTVYKSSIKVVSVDDMECDAQIALIRATRRYMFDFSCSLKLQISIDTDIGSLLKSDKDSDDSSASVYEGLLTVVCVMHIAQALSNWTKSPVRWRKARVTATV